MASFTLQTWNCFGAAQGLVSFFRWRGAVDAHRFAHPEVHLRTAEVDVLCVQEIWLGDVEEFFEQLPHAHKRRDPNHSTAWPPTVGGSGLGIASKHEIVAHGVEHFSRPHVGSERVARKGLLHARVRVAEPAIDVDVITTHMQSGESSGARAVRARQVRELRALIDRVGGPERAVIVCGDMNIDGLRKAAVPSEYATLRQALEGFVDLGEEGDLPTFHPHPDKNELAHRFEPRSPEQRIDYILLRQAPRGPRVSVRSFDLSLHQPIGGEHGPRTFPSDHFALRATFDVGP